MIDAERVPDVQAAIAEFSEENVYTAPEEENKK